MVRSPEETWNRRNIPQHKQAIHNKPIGNIKGNESISSKTRNKGLFAVVQNSVQVLARKAKLEETKQT